MKKLVMLSAAILFVLLPASSMAEQPLFGPVTINSSFSNPFTLCAADFDGDGHVDLATGLYYNLEVGILFNDGEGGFADLLRISDASGGAQAVSSADFDRDGDQDLLLVYPNLDAVGVMFNSGGRSFTVAYSFSAGDSPRSVCVADFNLDGAPDVAAANYSSNDVSILLNNGAGSFDAAVDYAGGSGAQGIAVSDLDGDNDQDLVVANFMSNSYSVLLNDGDGTFAGQVLCEAGGSQYGVAAADLDLDGDCDLAFAMGELNGAAICLNNGDGTFAAAVMYSSGSYPYSLEAADLDGDGHCDLAVPNTATADLSILLNDGDGTFGFPTKHSVGMNPRGVAAADFDGDGDRDVAVANRNSNFISKMFNLSTPGIQAVRDIPGDQGGKVYLSWSGALADVNMTGDVTRYSIWRAISPEAAIARMEAAMPRTGGDFDPVRMDLSASGTQYWELVELIDAYGMEGYGRSVATYFDSTADCSEYHYFQVIAHTAEPAVFWKTPPDSGYSVDNLSPSFPPDLQGVPSADPEGLLLSWKPGGEADLDHYAIYRGTDLRFDTGGGSLVAAVSDTLYFDGGWRSGAGYYYKVRAVDTHGNQGPFSLLRPEDVAGSDIDGIPQAAFLYQNYPNPFNPVTRVVFGLDRPENVNISIYDPAGRLVRVLFDGHKGAGRHEMIWDGRTGSGRAVASGVYLYRLVAGTFEETRKMVLLK